LNSEPTIADLVRNRNDLQRVLRELLDRQFLLPGVFHPEAYLRNDDKILSAWRRKKTRLHAIARGLVLYNEFLREIVNHSLRGEEPVASRATQSALDRWKAAVATHLPAEQADIEDISALLGQYLEFVYRKLV
jgi:hypothetical protein